MNDKIGLEDYIDKHGFKNTLDAIAEICLEKAEHIQTNWQDANAAASWIGDANAISKIAYTSIRN